jgi:penicillin-binding protein 2
MINNEILRHQLISRRVFFTATGKVALLSVLFARLFYLQLMKGNDYKILSDKNRIHFIIIPPTRGVIKDRNGSPIAENRSSFLLKLDKKQTKNYINSLEKLFSLVSLDDQTKRDLFAKLKKVRSRGTSSILEDISWDTVSIVEENLSALSGIFIEQVEVRKYNFPESTCHLTGYIGKFSEQDLVGNDKMSSEFMVGKTSLEKHYEDILKGEIGYKKVEVDANGLFVSQIEKVESVPGNNLDLNIDIGLQNLIYSLSPKEGCSTVVMDIHTGAIIALCSTPSFNPEDFLHGISKTKWDQLTKDPYKPLINKITQAQYPPGSTFKLITVLAALESGMKASQEFFCSGHIILGSRAFNCSSIHGHGTLNLIQSIQTSCNCYMYNIARTIGAEKILSVAKRFEYGMPTKIDLPGELNGFVPDRNWKIRNFKFDWTLADTFNIAIGQGALLSTPVQQAKIAASFANGKYIIRPRIAKIVEEAKYNILINPEHLEIIHQGMYKVVNERGGSSFKNSSSLVEFAGKTGTSQVIAKKNALDDLSSASVKWDRRNHALFAGFTPFKNPKYAISIIIDHGGGGGRAASPIAKAIAEYIHLNDL